MRALALLALALAASGCTLWFDGDDAPAVPPDARERPDARVYPDAAPGPCGYDGFPFRGSLVDIESPVDAAIGIAGAKLVQRGVADRAGTTDASGAFDFCAGDDRAATFDVDMPEGYSDLVLVDTAHGESLRGTTLFRVWKSSRAAAFYSAHGLTYDPAKAHLVITDTGDPLENMLDRSHAAPLASSHYGDPTGTVWTSGIAGPWVWFPNVDASQPTGTLNRIGNEYPVPLAAGKVTLVSAFFVWL